MHTRTAAILALGLSTVVPSSRARAQAAGDFAAYDALLETPIGALTPIMTSTITGGLQQSVQFTVRYAYMKERVFGFVNPGGSVGFASDDIGANNFAATAILPAGLGSTISLTAGAFYPTCAGCKSHLMLSAGGDLRLASMAMSGQADSPLFLLALNGELGFGAPSDVRLFSVAIGAPVSLMQRGQGMRVGAFVTPQLGFGTAYYTDAIGGGNDSGTRFAIGGGFGVWNPASTVSVTLGAQYVDFPHSTGVYGVSVRLGQ